MRPSAIAVLLASAVAATVPADAAGARVGPAAPQCPVDTVCFWENQQYAGEKGEVKPQQGCNAIPGTRGAKSAMNVTRGLVLAFEQAECKGQRVAAVFPNAMSADLAMTARSFHYLAPP